MKQEESRLARLAVWLPLAVVEPNAGALEPALYHIRILCSLTQAAVTGVSVARPGTSC